MMSRTESASATPERPQPIAQTGGRIAGLDFIRGIAVMGILAANIISLGQPQTAYAFPDAFTTGHSQAEDWMWVAQLVLIDGKMRGLFTILFGAGLCLFIDKARAKGASRMLQVRRLFWLGLFGLFHFYLIWQGDILFAYALSGLIATLFLIDLEPRQQLVVAGIGYIAGGIFYAISMIFMQQVADNPAPDSAALAQVRSEFIAAAEADLGDGEVETILRQEGTHGDITAHVVSAHGTDPFYSLMDFPFETLPLMLIGMALYRTGLFTHGYDPVHLRRWGWGLVCIGGALTLWIGLATKAGGLTYYGTLAAHLGWSHIPRLLMTLGYLFLLVLHVPQAGSWLGERISAAGRAAFTNYLGTSIVMLAVFAPWGLGLFAQLGRSELYLVAIAGCAAMLAWSKPWLDRFRYGPLEWLWRCLTYGRLFALRR